MKGIPVKDKPGLVRDPRTGAILNTNDAEINIARARKSKRLQDKFKQENLELEITKLKDDVEEVKHLLNKIIDKL